MENLTARHPAPPQFPDGVTFAAKLFSYLLHPLFLPMLVTFMAVTALPEYFTPFRMDSIRLPYDKLYFRVGVNTLLFPMLVVTLAVALKFVSSIHMEKQQDRIIPYVATIIFYFWTFYTFLREGKAPPFFTAFFLGIFITASVCLVANSFIKISMHTTGWGGVIGFFLVLMWGMGLNVAIPLGVVLVFTGIAATSRLVLSAHTTWEVYIGLFTGILAQLVAWWIIR
ncbi:hypothetical protein MKQ70_28550 [Chitinophaga sedimenti]|uniref:hypothetical protein n=1 Tax=Chitinophaga sedimenti TaxID=2033606 RepID=UPI0020032AEB|nr:hypothetical protein [Chitinophaga sedimenti]MCK7558726.1 hypothetical protein [Chitinophaga sedimenti]